MNSYFPLSNESRTLPLHLWRLLSPTHRNGHERARAKEGEDAKLWGLGCVNPFVSRRISFHGVSTGLHRFTRRGNSSGTTVVLYDSSTYFSRGSYVPSFGRSTDSTAIRNRNDRRERSSSRLESYRRPLGNDPTTDLFRFLRNDTELDRNLTFSGLLSFPLLRPLRPLGYEKSSPVVRTDRNAPSPNSPIDASRRTNVTSPTDSVTTCATLSLMH